MENEIVTHTREQAIKFMSICLERYGLSELIFKENAGLRTANLLEKKGIYGKIMVCCGKGNNAAVGLVLARYLAGRQYDVEVWMFADANELSRIPAINLDILRECGDRVFFYADQRDKFEESLYFADWIVDAFFGLGAFGPPREPYAHVIRRINHIAKKVLAVDIPSGFDIDSGTPHDPTIKATCTATLVAHKKGFFNPEAAEYLGEIHVIDIGVSKNIFVDTEFAADSDFPSE